MKLKSDEGISTLENNMLFNNSGSTIIEVSIIMPILIFIIVSVIFLFLYAINDAVIQGESYCGIYELSVGENEETIKENINSSMENKIVGIGNIPKLSLNLISGEISAAICAINVKGGRIYSYQGKAVSYKREYDKCTQRLRRWQLYGDILQE